MKILAIGNSFSQDATRYLYAIAKADGYPLTAVNLCIGGCPLSKHYFNMLGNKKDYMLEYNGETTMFKMSLEEALLAYEWDVVTIQQVSHLAPNYATYQPYLNELNVFLRKCAPKARLLLQETWAYEHDSNRLVNELKYATPEEMYADIHASYAQAAEEINADIIPSGTLFMHLIKNGIPTVHRDTFHASLGLGRYALGLLWYKKLTGKSIDENSFRDFDKPVTEEEIAIIKKSINEIL